MGGANATDCGDCPPGTFSDSEGAATCTACAAGTASNATRATSSDTCAKCPPSTYAGSASSSCSTCPSGSFPDAAQASCLVGVYVCAAGSAPVSSAAPTSAASCAPLVCLPPLTISADNETCLGCAANTSGTYPACAACAGSSVCPGLTAAPLVSAAAFASTAAAMCPLLTGPGSLAPSITVRPLAQGFSWLTGILSIDGTLLSGIAAASLAVLLFIASRAFAAVDRVLASVDAFALRLSSDRGAPLDLKARPIGGTFSLLGAIAFCTLALTLVLQRAADNVNSQRSVVVLDAGAARAAAVLPVYSAAPWGAGIQVRITASGDGGVCASGATWTATDVGWTIARTPSCGGSAVSQLVFSCADCALTPTSSLSISLHYSCQALLVEAAALDGAGVVTAFALPTGETTTKPGELMTVISWTLPALLSVVNSSISPSARGFTLTAASHTVASVPLVAGKGGGLAVVPTAASIAITIALPLNTFYAVTLLSEKQSIAALLTSIVGLAGVFGFFGSLLSVTDAVSSRVFPPSSKPPLSSTPHSATPHPHTNVDEKGSVVADIVNPLVVARLASGPTLTDVVVTAPAVTRTIWRKKADDYATWYENDEGDFEWELPAGGITE